MSIVAPLPRLIRPLHPAVLAAAAALLLGAGTPAGAQEADPLLQLLGERGLLAAPASPVGHERASEVVLAAMNFLDLPYRYGGTSVRDGFDCSGFTQHLFGSVLGVQLPRRSDEQAREASLLEVGRDELQPGDLVFFNTLRRAFSHVGIYIGDGRFIHAPRTGAQVRVESMAQSYWQRRFDGARRPISAGSARAAR